MTKISTDTHQCHYLIFPSVPYVNIGFFLLMVHSITPVSYSIRIYTVTVMQSGLLYLSECRSMQIGGDPPWLIFSQL